MSNSECLKIYPWMAPMLSRPNAKTINYRVTDFTVDSRKFCNQIENFAKENGAIFNYNCAVKKLNIKNGKVIGVQLTNGTFIPADLGKFYIIDIIDSITRNKFNKNLKSWFARQFGQQISQLNQISTCYHCEVLLWIFLGQIWVITILFKLC